MPRGKIQHGHCQISAVVTEDMRRRIDEIVNQHDWYHSSRSKVIAELLAEALENRKDPVPT